MAETVIAATLELDSSQASKSIKQVKAEITEATAELKKLQTAFGETSEAATKVANKLEELQGSVKEIGKSAKEESDPFKMFDEFKESVENVTGGIKALTDTMALMGIGSKDVEEALKKVESGLEFAENIKKGIKGFMDLKDMAVDAFKTIKGAVISSGIGALVVALGTIYAYWDDIKGVISGVSSEQKKNLETATENASLEKEKLASIDAQSNVLKAQGKSEKDILELKALQIKKVIEQARTQLAVQEKIDKQQIESSDRNQKFVKSFLESMSKQLFAITSAADKFLARFGFNSNLSGGLQKGIDSVAKLMFNTEELKKQVEQSHKEAQKGIDGLVNQEAGLHIQIAGINKQAAEKQNEFKKQLRDKQNEAKYAEITDEYKLAKEKLADEYKNQQDEIEQSKRTKDQKDQLLLAAKELFNAKDKKLEEAHTKDIADHEQDALEKLKKMREENAAAISTDKHAQNEAQIKSDFEAQEKEIKNLQATEDVKTKMLEEAKIKRDRLLKQNDTDNPGAAQNVINDITNAHAGENKSPFEKERDELKKWHKDKLKAVGDNEQAIAAINEEYELLRTEITERENTTRLKQIESVLGQAASIFGKNTIAFKVLSVAQATINTFLGVSDALSVKTFTIFDTIAKFVNAGAILAAGLANVKKIVAVQVPGASGGSAPPVSSAAPLMPSPQTVNTQLPQAQINQIGNATVRAYVLEQDIDQDRSRTTRLNRAARLGG